MSIRTMKTGLLAAILAMGLAAAHAQGLQTVDSLRDTPTAGLDLTLHLPLHGWQAAADDVEGSDGLPALGDGLPALGDAAAAGTPGASGEHRVAPRLALLTGFDPYTVFDALDFKPRVGDVALGLKVDF